MAWWYFRHYRQDHLGSATQRAKTQNSALRQEVALNFEFLVFTAVTRPKKL
jgi:hypothetical protein